MPKKSKLLIFLLLLVIFTKGVVWSFFIPAWHFPDEQEHFAHIACNAEAKKECGRSAPESGNLNKEIYLSLDLLGVDRDSFGNNKFTYHPEYNIDYSGNFTGIYEKQIINIPLENRTIFVKNDIAQYPEFFYNISKIPYNLVYFSDLFTRLFAVRIFWLALVLVIVYCAFKTGEMVGSKKFALTCAVLVGFHPMLTFVSSGVTGDNLYNALSSLVIFFCAYILTKGLKLKYLAVLVLLIILGIKTKPQFLIMLGIILSVVLYRTIVYLKKNKLKIKNLLIPACILVVIFAFLNFLLKYRISKITSGGFYFYLGGKTAIESYSLADHFLWTAKHTFREVLPWYWGVFRWLSLALPRWVNRVQMRILLVAGIGLVYKLVLLAKNKKFSKKDIVFLFMLYSAVLYFLVLFVWDWDFTRSHGFSFGIQGRYYFPVIIPQMILLVVGMETLFKTVLNLIGKFLKLYTHHSSPIIYYLLCLWFIVLNCIAFYWLTASYYDTSSFSKFIIQASQYKLWFAKGYWLVFLLIIYFFATGIFTFNLIKCFFSKSDEK